MEKLISIIVPVYNVEKYLNKCVNSIINQTYKNIEIILVNDGSTDRSGHICDELSKLDHRIVVYHKENGGLSDARNYGVKRANGEYIGFVDSDDYVSNDMYQYLYEIIERENADVAECNFYLVYQDAIRQYFKEYYYEVLDKQEYLKEYLLMNKVYGAVCWKLIKSEVAKKLEFPIGKFYEDAFYHLELIKIAEKYVLSSKSKYYYLMRGNSITNSKFNEKHMDNIEISELFYKYVINNYPYIEEEANNKVFYSYFSVMNKILEQKHYVKDINYYKIKKYFKGNIISILKNKIISKKRKLAVIFLLLNEYMYRKFLLKYQSKLRG